MTKRPLAIIARALLVLLISTVHAQAQDAPTPDYIGTDACAQCHDSETQDWVGSHHALAWTAPDPANALGDFSGVDFYHRGVLSRFSTEDNTLFIDTDGPDGTITKYPVAGIVGIAPLQQYLIETEPGKLQSFDVVWDDEAKTWYHLYPDQDLTFADGLHWTGPYKNWNARCAECHATGFEKNFDPLQKTYSSTQSEIGVGCEACHGPGAAHRDWALANGQFDPARWAGVNDLGFTMDFNAGAEPEIQQCAGCHSRREAYADGNPLPGTPFHDAYRLSTLRPGLYHADGQILDEVYVYGSFLQSKMYAKGVACTDCHNPHTAGLVAKGNAVCAQCHSPAGNSRFPSLTPAVYDDPSHHFHAEGSDGAQCISCHMIERTYMGVDGRRDHSFRIPRPDLSVQTRAPNACNDCHSDQTASWAAEVVAGWYPDSPHRGDHFSQTLSRVRSDPRGQVENLLNLVEYPALAGIVRATILDELAQITTPEIAQRTAFALADPDPLVRAAAIPVQRGAPETERPNTLMDMLEDPVRSVRITAAREFLNMNIVRMPKRVTENLSTAMGEWQATLQTKADFPETQLVLAGIGLTTRRMDVALSAFGEAVELDPQLVQAWSMMVRIHAALGNKEAALETVNAAILANPQDIDLNLMKAELSQ
jgi:predicted CXXCH cytochrome family protein